MAGLGTPRLHLRSTASTNDRARALAAAGAPHGALVTAGHQTAGRGRQGRSWSAAPGSALLMSLVLHGAPPLVTLAAAVAVADACGEEAAIKWPNDVLVDGRKVSGILAEGRAGEPWTVLGIGVNVALAPAELPPELHATATTLGLPRGAVEPFLARLLDTLERALALPADELLERWRARDALLGRDVAWAEETGVARGVDDRGHLVVDRADGQRVALDAGEVHLRRPPGAEGG